MSNTGDPIVPSGEPSGAPTVQYREPEDYAELKAFRESVQSQILPHWDLIEPILSNEDERQFVVNARKSRDVLRQQQEPELPPEFQTFEKRLESKFGGVVEYITKQQEREAQEAQRKEAETAAENQRAFEANRAYAQRIMAERADFRNADGGPSQMMEDLIILASQRKMSIEDAYKEYGPRYFGVKPQAVERPRVERNAERSLRNGDPGVPGESTAPKATTQKERQQRMRASMLASLNRGA